MQGVVFLGDCKLKLMDFPDPMPGPRMWFSKSRRPGCAVRIWGHIAAS